MLIIYCSWYLRHLFIIYLLHANCATLFIKQLYNTTPYTNLFHLVMYINVTAGFFFITIVGTVRFLSLLYLFSTFRV